MTDTWVLWACGSCSARDATRRGDVPSWCARCSRSTNFVYVREAPLSAILADAAATVPPKKRRINSPEKTDVPFEDGAAQSPLGKWAMSASRRPLSSEQTRLLFDLLDAAAQWRDEGRSARTARRMAIVLDAIEQTLRDLPASAK